MKNKNAREKIQRGAVVAYASRYYASVRRRISSTTPETLLIRHLSTLQLLWSSVSFTPPSPATSTSSTLRRYFSESGINQNKKMVEHL
ncbi:unnamed protein product [Rhodiola kirilowii]